MSAMWASIAGLFAFVLAWVTYVSSVIRDHKHTAENVRSVITGIEKELELMKDWAGDEEEGPGYLEVKSREDYWKDKLHDWGNPSRLIHQFDYPAIKGITSSILVRFFTPVIDDFVLLNYSIMRLFDFYSDYRQFANADIDLNMTVVETCVKATKKKPINIEELGEREKKYINRIFTYNWTIHVRLIGGSDSKNSICLFRTYNEAKKSLERFKNSFKREPLPGWFWIGHGLAVVFLLGAIGLILAGFGVISLTSSN